MSDRCSSSPSAIPASEVGTSPPSQGSRGKSPSGALDSCANRHQQNVLRGTTFHLPQMPSVGRWSGVLYEKSGSSLYLPLPAQFRTKKTQTPKPRRAGPAGQGAVGLLSGPLYGTHGLCMIQPRGCPTGSTLVLLRLERWGSWNKAGGGNIPQWYVLTNFKQLPSSASVPGTENIFLNFRGQLLLTGRPEIQCSCCPKCTQKEPQISPMKALPFVPRIILVVLLSVNSLHAILIICQPACLSTRLSSSWARIVTYTSLYF